MEHADLTPQDFLNNKFDEAVFAAYGLVWMVCIQQNKN